MKKVVLLAVAAALSVLAIASFSGCTLSALSSQSKPADVDDGMTTVERDGYSFECPSDWKWEKYSDDSIVCRLDGEKGGESILIQEESVGYDSDGAISIDDMYEGWIDVDGERTYTNIQKFKVGKYDWLSATHIRDKGSRSNNLLAAGSISSSEFVRIDYLYGDHPKREAEFNSMIDSIKLI